MSGQSLIRACSETPERSHSGFLVSTSPLLLLQFPSTLFHHTMSDTFQELADIPKDFVREGTLFVRRCTKRTPIPLSTTPMFRVLTVATADKREFIKISQAVGMGFLVMVCSDLSPSELHPEPEDMT